MYKRIKINTKLRIGKRGKKTERSQLRRRRSALDYSAIEEEEEEEEEGGGGGGVEDQLAFTC
jgi:hypothetical protein